MSWTADDYYQLLVRLLPPGDAWAGDDTFYLKKILLAWAEEFARIEARAEQIVEEADPRTVDELLAEWERVLGLPDPDYPVPASDAERRAAIISREIAIGGQSAPYFIEVAASLGHAGVTITTVWPAWVGIAVCGDPLSNGFWQYTWQMNVLEIGPDALLEKVLERIKPSDSSVLFSYGV